jgi:hypothetical protein
LPPVGEWLHEQLMGDDGGARGAYAANLHQHLPLVFDRGVLRPGDIPLALDGAQLALQEVETWPAVLLAPGRPTHGLFRRGVCRARLCLGRETKCNER